MIHRATLDNGVRLVVRPTHAAPLAAMYLWMEAGSVDEQPGEEGAAHFLEHMLFKGTGRRGVGEAAAEIEGLGGDLNAYTSFEQTVVHATVEASAWEHALDVVVDMVRYSLFDPEEFVREKKVILEEIRGYLEEPETLVADAAAARLYPGHPYGRPILGSVDSIGAMSRDDLVAFWRRTYDPRRLIISIAGAVDAERVEGEIRRHLGDWAPGTGERQLAPAQAGPPSVLRLDGGFESTVVEIGWRVAPLGHPDVPALDVLAAALGDGLASVLPVRLQIRDRVASDVGATLSVRTAGGDLTVGFLPREARTADAVESTLDEVARVTRHGLTGAQVARARDACLADFLFGSETVDGLAHDAAWFTARMGAPEARDAYRAAVAAVTSDDVARVAGTWLTPDRCTVVALDQHLGAKRLKRAAMAMHRFSSRPAREPTRHVFDNGATLWVLPDDTPVCAVRLVALGGALAVDSRRAGLHTLWSRAVTAGVDGLDAGEFAEEVDDIAGTLDGTAGRNTLGLSATFPAEHVQEGIGLLGRTLTAPAFDPDEVARLRDELIEEVRTLEDRAGEVATQELWGRLWPGHPWRLPSTGTEPSLERIGSTTLRRWHHRLLTGDNVVVAVAGGVDPDAVRDAWAPWLDKLGAGPYDLPARDTAIGPRTGVRRRRAGREQAWVIRAVRGPDVASPRRFALMVAAAVLGSQGGRLFMGLREAHGLAYSVWARSMAGWDGGAITAGLATDRTRVDEARAALASELDRFARLGPTEVEFDRARRMLVGEAAMGLQRAIGRATDAALGDRFGLRWGMQAFREAMDAVTLPEVCEAAHEALSQEPVEVIVEPET